MKSRIMNIEYKGSGLTGDARIGRVRFTRTFRSLYYGDVMLQKFKGYKANYVDANTGEEYWVSGCKKDGIDRLYNESTPIWIDADAQDQVLVTG